MRTAANAPVVTRDMPAAALWDSVAEAEALAAVADPDLEAEAVEEGAAEEVEAAAEEAAAEEAERTSAVALRVPHCSFCLQTLWAWASLGLLLIHWM